MLKQGTGGAVVSRDFASESLKTVALILTSECNLRCAYCFENSKGPGRMEWHTLRAALDLALKHGQRRTKILFSGGEPLLEFDLIRKAWAHTKRELSRNKELSFTLITNGILLTEERVTFLARRSINVQVSFDGVSAAQDVRAEGTFASLDRLLNRLRRGHPDFYKNHVRISATVIPQTVRYMADSFGYFLAKGARRVAIAPSIANSPSWKPDQIRRLERQFAEVYEMSLAHFDRTGDVPLVLFQPTEKENSLSKNNLPQSRNRDGVRGRFRTSRSKEVTGMGNENQTASSQRRSSVQSRHICAAGRGEMLAVDVDGSVYPCITLAGSCQKLGSTVLRKSADAMRLGNLAGHQFWERYHRLPEVARRLPIFGRRENRHSSYRVCRDCQYFAQCLVCPVSLGHLPGNENCERVSDFTCAFTFTALKYRERFLEQISLRRKS